MWAIFTKEKMNFSQLFPHRREAQFPRLLCSLPEASFGHAAQELTVLPRFSGRLVLFPLNHVLQAYVGRVVAGTLEQMEKGIF